MALSKLDFPTSPVNGQIYSQNGLSYQYDGTYGVWVTTVVSPIPTPTMANNQVMFVDGPYPNGSYGLVFVKGSNTTFANTVTVSGNVTASYLIGNGSALTNLPLLPANNWTNTSITNIGISANNYAGYMANSVNAYVSTVTGMANTSGISFRGNLNFPNGNVSIATSGAPTALYVNGSAAATVNTLVDGATVVPQFWSNNNFTLTLGGNRAMANPANPTVGQSGVIYIIQDATGGRTLTWGANWDFQGNTAPTLSTGGGSVDILVYAVRTTSNIHAQLINNN